MNREQALKFTEENLLPTILTYWTDKTLKGMTIEAKEALQKLWKEHIRPGTTYMISCPDCPAMGLDTIGAWYCKAYGLPPSVAVIQAGIDGTIEELKNPKPKEPAVPFEVTNIPPVTNPPDVFSALPPAMQTGQASAPTKHKK